MKKQVRNALLLSTLTTISIDGFIDAINADRR